RLPPAPADLCGDHGGQASAHPARPRLARRAGRAFRRAPRSARSRRRPGSRPRAGDRGSATGRPRMSGLLALGISYKTAPLDLREQCALTEGRAAGVIRGLLEFEAVTEAAALSTCNRTELYLVT